MEKEEVAAGVQASCVRPGESVSFECILSAINDIRGGNFGVLTVRKLMLQVDNALSNIAGEPADITLAAAAPGDLLALCDQVEASCRPTEVSALGVSPILVSLLIALLKAALERML